MRAVRIERLIPAQHARLRAVRLRALQEAPDAFASTYEDTLQRPPDNWRQQLESLATFVAVVDGEDVGMVRGGPFDGRPDAAILLSMWVAPSARGTGAGDALVKAVIGWARDAGFVHLVLDVAMNNTPAVKLYARHGFVPTGNTGTLPPPREHVREQERSLMLREPGAALSTRGYTPAHTAELAAFIHACTGGAMETEWAAFVLEHVVAGPAAVRDVWRGDQRVGVGVCMDTCETEGDAAELSVFCAEPFDPIVLHALLQWGQTRATAARRRNVDVPAWPGTRLPTELLQARGFRLGHVMFNMRRPHDAGAPPQPRTALPAGWRWQSATVDHAAAYHATVSASFRGMPSAFVSPVDVFEQRLAVCDPAPLLLLTDDPTPQVAAFLRVEPKSDGTGDIGSLGRHPRYRGMGLGQHLIARGIEWLGQLGAGDLTLEVAATNAAGLALYESAGFVIEREMPVYRRAL